MRDVLIMGVVGGGTLAMRSVFIVGSTVLPARVERIMRHARPAILASLVGGFLAGGSGVRLDGVAALAAAWIVGRLGGGMLVMLATGILVAMIVPV
jgi:hypothetical protein